MAEEHDAPTASGEHGTNEGALWGARFAAGPSPELARLSKSTHFDWELAPYDLAGSRAHARALAAAGYLDRRGARRMLAGLDALERRRRRRARSSAGDADEDVHGALERALIGIVGPELGGKLRAGRSRNDQIATLVRLYLLDHAATHRRSSSCTSSTRSPRRPTRTATAVMPGRTHLQHAQPVLLAHHLLAHALAAGARPRAAARLASAGGRLALRRRCARRAARSASTPASVAAELGLGAPGRELDRRDREPRRRGRVRLHRRADRHRPLALRRGDHPLEHPRVRLRHASTTAYSTGSSIMPQKKNPDIAELARGKAGRLIGNLTGPARHPQGPAARVQPRPAGGQGAGLRLGRDPRGAAAGVHRHGRDAHVRHRADGRARARRASRSRRMSRSGSCKRHVPFREAHEITGALVRYCEEHGLELDEPTTRRSPRSRRTSRPTCATCSRSRARSRAATGSAAPRRCASPSSSPRSPSACGTCVPALP